MLVAAALVPETALLVEGAGGRADPLVAERAAALDAVRALLAARPDRVVVVVASAAGEWAVGSRPPVGRSLGAAGVPDGLVAAGLVAANTVAEVPVPEAAPVTHGLPATADDAFARPLELAAGAGSGGTVAAAVAVRLLAEAGWVGVVEVTGAGAADAARLRVRGEEAVERGRTALLLVGSLSARNGPEAPLPHDPRAVTFDDAAVPALVAIGDHGAGWLASVPAGLAVELAVSAWGPWQVLLGAAAGGVADGHRLRGSLHSRTAPFGATYAVMSWLPDDAGAS